MHLEGKLHTGYLKIRNKLAELKRKKDSQSRSRREHRRGRSRSRSNSPRARRGRDSRGANPQEEYVDKSMFSSRVYGSGVNMPMSTELKFTDQALRLNH
mmetsp:Transcript_118591/g.165264  ORF Transcript_118591/g.165264 Transcript_118591/m.165264 type:complete len:99 (+) Transcript_118591:675-971(+)